MTKSLTEKWKDGDLADDCLYYWRISDGQILVKNKLEMCAFRLCSDADKIECLEPVPTYEEYQDILQQNVNQESAIETYIEQIKELEERLADADKTIKETKEIALSVELSGLDYNNRHKMYDIMFADGIIDRYLTKWGVK